MMISVKSNLKLFAATALLVLGQACVAQSVPPMAADAKPGFEVATIKPSQGDAQRSVQVQGTRLATRATSLVDLMMFAYGIHPTQIADGPDWIKAERFDVVVQPTLSGRPSTAQMRSIVQQLLADRFKLAFHHDQRELPVYRLIAAKGGPELTPTTKEDEQATNTAAVGIAPGLMTVRNATLSEFASITQRYVRLDRPIVDHTGISGKYDYKLSWTPDFSQFDGNPPGPAKTDENAPSLYTAIQEQLGLKLEAVKELADVIVIDHVERPSEN